jgi:hypothetical protein
MTYLIGHGGKVLFRADWTDPPTIEWEVQYIQHARARRREGMHLAPFYAEIVGYRWSNPAKVREGLERAGRKAVDDFEARDATAAKTGAAARANRAKRVNLISVNYRETKKRTKRNPEKRCRCCISVASGL